jgi:hypothetical protein
MQKEKKKNKIIHCELCKDHGHDKYNCQNDIILFFSKSVEKKTQYYRFPEIQSYLERKEPYELEILAIKNYLHPYSNKKEMVYHLSKKYNERNNERKKRIFDKMIKMKENKIPVEISLNTIFSEVAVQILFLITEINVEEEELFQEIKNWMEEYPPEQKEEILQGLEYAKECYEKDEIQKAVHLSRIPFPREWNLTMKLKPYGCERVLNRKVVCPICLESKKQVIVAKTNCCHSFCRDCLSSYLELCKKKDPQCPLCRTSVSELETYSYEMYREFFTKYNDASYFT